MSGLSELAFALAALTFVLVLAWVALRLLARYGVGTGGGRPGGERRVRLLQSVAVGNRERLLLVRCDEREYLLLSSPHAATVVDRLGGGWAERSSVDPASATAGADATGTTAAGGRAHPDSLA